MISSRPRYGSLALFLSLVTGCSSSRDLGEIPSPTRGLELSKEDYLTARTAFQTHLLREGPASKTLSLPKTPDDAVELRYRSGPSTLRAFASPPNPGPSRKPAVLFLHGGFEFGEGHWAMTHPFRDAGFVVMIPTLRGENGQSGSFSLFFDEVNDVLAAADVLASRPDVDSTKVYLAGHSVGGTLTLLAALSSSRFRAAASFSGSPDQVEYTRGRPDRIPFDPTNPEEFRVRSPVAFATHFQCPIRLYHGEDEYWLQDATRRTALLAQRAGLDVQAIEVAGGHDTANPEVIQACIAFFRGL